MYVLLYQDEIEVAMVHNGTGYVALGWRPGRGIDGSCRSEAPGSFPVGKSSGSTLVIILVAIDILCCG